MKVRGYNYVSELSFGYWKKKCRNISVSVSCPGRELSIVHGTSQAKGGYEAGVAFALNIFKSVSRFDIHTFKGKK